MLNKSAHKSHRAVPIDPDLKLRRSWLWAIVLLPIGIGISFLPKEFRYGIILTSSFPLLASMFYPTIYFFLSQKIKEREQNRQQAAVYTPSFMPETPIDTLSQSVIPPLPAYIVIRMQRSLLTTYVVGSIFVLILLFFFGSAFQDWQSDVYTAIQKAHPLHGVLLGITLDMFLLWSMVASIFQFIISPHHRQLIVTEDCLIFSNGSGKLFSIPWHEARLFAIIAGTKKENASLLYELSSQTATIRWTSKPVASLMINPYGSLDVMGWTTFGVVQPYPSEEAYMHQISMLNYIITARTHLYLHDLR